MTTNRDKINAMTNEELTEFLEETTTCERCSPYCKPNCKESYETCLRGFLKWLESEVENV